MIKQYIPLFPKTRQIKKTYFLIPIFITAIAILHYLKAYDTVKRQFNFRIEHVDPLEYPVSKFHTQGLTILPSNFDPKLRLTQNITQDNAKIIEFGGSVKPISNYITGQTYIPHPFLIFASTPESASEEAKHKTTRDTCKSLEIAKNVTILQDLKFHDNWKLIASTLLEQITHDPAFVELRPFFQEKLPEIIEKDALNEKHFYKFAATSVWLAKHGVHLMVSRVIFSQNARKANPQISLLYAQIYDEKWVELQNVDLVVPVIDEFGERKYEVMNFPKFMPIPFYHNVKKIYKRWYGPEDTRLLLVKNEYGDEEPVVVYNSFHRQVIDVQTKANNDEVVRTKYGFYRSMFMGYLFRYQQGKQNTDGQQERRYKNVIYNKVAELRIDGKEREKTEKNWTPFVNPLERGIATRGGDKYLYIVYQWDHLKILRCELASPGVVSRCIEQFKQDDSASKVGPVRGGTELIPISTTYSSHSKGIKQIWIGFLRAHLNQCGCGKAMYRPNFVVLIQHKNGNFKIAYLSSSISMNMQVDGWKYAEIQCAKRDPNVLIPNGISMYDPKLDFMSLTLSVADKDDNLVHLGGVQKLIDTLNFKWDGRISQSKQVDCVIDESITFCKKYGELQDYLGVSQEAIELAKQAGMIDNKSDEEKAKEEANAKANANANAKAKPETPEKEQENKGQDKEESKALENEQSIPVQQDEHPGEDTQDRVKGER